MKALTANTIANNFTTVWTAFHTQIMQQGTLDTVTIEGDKVLVWRSIYIIATYTVHGNSRKGYTFEKVS